MSRYGISRIAAALALVGAFVVLMPGVSFAVPIVVEADSRTTFAGEGLTGTGGWTNGGLIIQWEISFDNDTDLWTYQYTFLDDDTGPDLEPDLSHWILELSDHHDQQHRRLILSPDSPSIEARRRTGPPRAIPACPPTSTA
jgi:hypothetical protein